ncbi:MAG: hypothetical protein JWL83_586 [Actinomycetia bacterium]|jgi:hypothetical protein|nr:hypothetical protein [Actinomycetes bacterium]
MDASTRIRNIVVTAATEGAGLATVLPALFGVTRDRNDLVRAQERLAVELQHDPDDAVLVRAHDLVTRALSTDMYPGP